MLELGAIVVALAALILGSGWVVRGATSLAYRARLSPMVVGLTVLSLGTSLPEIATNLSVGWQLRQGAPSSGLAVGNVVGSCLSQITLLLGITIVISTLRYRRRILWLDGTMVLVAALLMWLVASDGTATQGEGLALLLGYLAYLGCRVWYERSIAEPAPVTLSKGTPQPVLSLWKSLGLLALGMAIVILSADRLVNYGVEFAEQVGLQSEYIGLWVGVGTGLPELSVALRAIHISEGAMSLGNLLGSNIADPMLSFGSGVMLHDVAVAEVVLEFDIPLWVGATILMLVLAHHRCQLDRMNGVVLLSAFTGFMVARTFFL